MKKEIHEAFKSLQKARELADRTSSPWKKLSMNQAITRMRRIRKKVWEEKFAVSARHK